MKYILIIIWLIFAVQLQAQQAFQWVVSSGGVKEDVVNAIASHGNDLYMTGKYAGKFVSGDNEVEANGATDIYLVRMNGNGKTDWVKNLGGKDADEATCLTVDADNLYIGGQINGVVKFDKKEFTGEGTSLFAAKCSDKGKPDWLTRFGVTGHATLDVLECSPNGRLLVGGMLYGTLDAGVSILKSTGVSRAFSIQLSAEGKPESATLSTGKGNHRLVSATFDTDGNQYLLFSISGIFNYGVEPNLCSSGIVSKGLVLLKSSAGGEKLWSKTFDCPGYSEGVKVIANDEGDLFVCANFSESLSSADTILTNSGSLEVAIMSFDSEGELKWARKVESPYKCRVMDAVITHSQEILLTGYFRYQYNIGDISGEGETVMGDLFLLQFGKQGNLMWHDEPGKEASSFSKAITLDKSGNVILAGGFSEKLEMGSNLINPVGAQDILVAKYFNCAQNIVDISDDLPICPESSKELKASGGFDTYLWNNSVWSKTLLIEESGVYFVEAMDELGCSSTDTVVIMEAPVDELYLIGDTTLYEGEEITLSASGGFVNYQWGDGKMGQSRTIQYDSEADSTVFRLTAQTDLGCRVTDSIIVWFNEANFELAGSGNKSYQVYPNPVSEMLYWYIESDKPANILVQLSDGRGTLVYQKEISNYTPYSKQEVDMKNLASGNYMLSLFMGDIILNKKIVKR